MTYASIVILSQIRVSLIQQRFFISEVLYFRVCCEISNFTHLPMESRIKNIVTFFLFSKDRNSNSHTWNLSHSITRLLHVSEHYVEYKIM